MTQKTGTIESLAGECASALALLSIELNSPETLIGFLEEIGWQVPETITAIGIDPGSVGVVIQLLEEAAELDFDTADSATIVAKYSVLLEGLAAISKHICSLDTRITAHVDPAFLAASNMAEELPRRLLDYLIVEYLAETRPALFHVLLTLGILELRKISGCDATFTSEHTRRIVHYSRLAQIITEPGGLLRDVHGWGTPAADLGLLIELLHDLAIVLGLPAGLEYPTYEKEVNLSAPVSIPLEGESENPELRIPILSAEGGVTLAEAGITLMPLPPLAPDDSPGLALCPYATGALEEAVPIDTEERWILTVTGSLDLVVGMGLLFRPGQTVSVLTDVLGSASSASGFLMADVRRQALPDESIPLLCTSTGMGLTAHTLYSKAGLVVGAGQETELLTELAVEGGRLRLDFESADSFLKGILPPDPLDIPFDLGVGWSSRRKIYFAGGAGLEYSLPIHKTIGPLQLDMIHFGIKFKDGSIRILMAITGSALFGPLAVSASAVGLEMALTFPSSGGNLGPVNLEPTFKPPAGVGLSIDTGVVKGGGYLYYDSQKEEYVGALELVISNYINMKAIGLITTRMPDGSEGFSLLIIITAEFGSGIQLGFGFVLTGVGGLLGLNRSMRLQPIMEGVRTGSINSIMFPKDVVANAPRIVSDLGEFFPPEQGKFLIGPMAKLGWGTPSLISMSLGIIIEIPGNVAILGVVKAALPADDADVLVLQANFAGAIEFGKKRTYFLAGLFESRVLFITIDGEMGLLMAWGTDPNFVLSVGGFHPQFNPPPLPFPNPKRVALSILNHSNARIQAMGYFGVTSNTVQFGANTELHFGFNACNVSGHIGFDALMQFSPFYFIVQISGSVSLKVFGMGLFSIRLRFSLEGPTPWRARGSGSISFFFFDISVDFDITWGESRDTSLPPIEVMPLLKAEFEKVENWTTELPSANHLLVSLREQDNDLGDLVLHPVGTLRITQKAVPLDVTIDKIGNRKVKDAKKFALSMDSGELSKISDTTESFAMGQFLEMDDTTKLARPAFERQHGGVHIAVQDEQLASSCMVKRIVRYETVIIDSYFKRRVLHFFMFCKGLFTHFLSGNAVTQSVFSSKRLKQFHPFAEKIQVKPDSYTVAFTSTNQAFRSEAREFASEALAHEYMLEQVRVDPGLVDQLHVIPQAEASNGT